MNWRTNWRSTCTARQQEEKADKAEATLPSISTKSGGGSVPRR